MARKQPFELNDDRSQSPTLHAVLEAATKTFQSGAGIPQETFWNEFAAENAGGIKKRSRPRKSDGIRGTSR
jgi:hypothetical protein